MSVWRCFPDLRAGDPCGCSVKATRRRRPHEGDQLQRLRRPRRPPVRRGARPQGRPRLRPGEGAGRGRQPRRLEVPRGPPRRPPRPRLPRDPGLGRRRSGGPAGRLRAGVQGRRRGHRVRTRGLPLPRHLRGVRRCTRAHPRPQAAQPQLRGGRGAAARRAHRLPGDGQGAPGQGRRHRPRARGGRRRRLPRRAAGAARGQPASSAPPASATTTSCGSWAPSP